MTITFYPGRKYSGNLYKYTGKDSSGNPIYTPIADGSVFSTKGHLIIRYTGGKQILDTDDTKVLNYVPGKGASLKGTGTTLIKS